MISDDKSSLQGIQSYFESASVGMSVYNVDRYWIDVNREFCRMLGYSKDELLKKNWSDFTHPEDIKICSDYHQKMLDGMMDKYQLDKRFIRKDGNVIYVGMYVTGCRNENGVISHLIASYIDNTEKFRISEKERKEHDLLRLVIDNIQTSICVLDKFGRKIISNKVDIRISGYQDEKQVLGKTFLDLYPGETGKAAHAENMEIMHSGNSIINDERVYNFRDGEMRTALISKIPIIGENNEISGMIGFGYDITDLRKMESKAKASEEYFETLIKLSPYGIIIADGTGNLTYSSLNAYKIFNVPESADISKLSIFDFVSPEDMDQALFNFRESITGIRVSRKWEYRFIKYDKTNFWCEVITSPLKDPDGRIKGLMVICNDITERKLAEEELIAAKKRLEQSDRFKTALLRNISHEIRTPLNAILGFSDLITDPSISNQLKSSYVEIINKSSTQLLSTINSLVDLSTIQTKSTKTNISDVNINEILTAIYNQFHLKAAKKNIQINVASALSDQEAAVRTDRLKLFQILSHLTENALKFTWYGQISIGCRQKNNEIEFSVSDTGIGIPGEFHSKVFDTFFRVEDSHDVKAEGIGMGLPICQAYVELLGGRIWFTSEPGKGSEFFFTIPGERSKPTAESTKKILFREDFTVLVVDDLETNLRYLADILMMSGIKVLLARNGINAIERCREEGRIDLVLMDLRMPVMDGYEAVTHIKDCRPDLPVIAQSAYVGEKELALNSGFDDFICKPFTRQQITEILRKYLS